MVTYSGDDLSRCGDYALQGFPVLVSEAPTPHSDATDAGAFNDTPVERGEEALACLSFQKKFWHCCAFFASDVVLVVQERSLMYTPRNFHCSTIDVQWWMLDVSSAEVNENLLSLIDIEQEVVVPAPCGQKVDFLRLVGHVILGDETYQSCVVCKLHHVICAVGWCAF